MLYFFLNLLNKKNIYIYRSEDFRGIRSDWEYDSYILGPSGQKDGNEVLDPRLPIPSGMWEFSKENLNSDLAQDLRVWSMTTETLDGEFLMSHVELKKMVDVVVFGKIALSLVKKKEIYKKT